jgi:hypothetical protein
MGAGGGLGEGWCFGSSSSPKEVNTERDFMMSEVEP